MKPKDFPAAAATCAALLLMFASGCSQGGAIAGAAPAPSSPTRPAAPSASKESRLPSRATLLAFAARIGVRCEIAKGRDDLDCIGGRPEVGDYYDVELHPSCGESSMLARVGPQKVELRDRIAPVDRRTEAIVQPGALLCVQAIGRAGEHASYYYVRRLDEAHATACTPGDACQTSRDFGDEGWARANRIVVLAQGN